MTYLLSVEDEFLPRRILLDLYREQVDKIVIIMTRAIEKGN